MKKFKKVSLVTLALLGCGIIVVLPITLASCSKRWSLLPKGYHQLEHQDKNFMDPTTGNFLINGSNKDWMIFFHYTELGISTGNSNLVGSIQEPNCLNFGNPASQFGYENFGFVLGNGTGWVDLVTNDNSKYFFKTKSDLNALSSNALTISWHDEWFAFKYVIGFDWPLLANFPGNEWLRDSNNWFFAIPN